MQRKLNPELSTILDYIRWSVSQLCAADVYFGHGTDNAWDEAIYLILHTLHLPQDVNLAILSAHLTQTERQAIVDVMWRRIQERKPTPYLTKTAHFAGLQFYVDERVLIPRSPIAELIEQRFAPWVDAGGDGGNDSAAAINLLDIGTGSGCIAIACAHAFPEAHVDAADISADALAVAAINVEKHHLQERVHLIQSDLFSAFTAPPYVTCNHTAAALSPPLHLKPKSQPAKSKNLKSSRAKLSPQQLRKYNVIISNPPYVDAADMQNLPAEYLHEPQSALAAGEDGLKFVERLLREAKNHLTTDGILIVEVGNSAPALIKKYPQLPFTWLEFERGDSEVFLLNARDL